MRLEEHRAHQPRIFSVAADVVRDVVAEEGSHRVFFRQHASLLLGEGKSAIGAAVRPVTARPQEIEVCRVPKSMLTAGMCRIRFVFVFGRNPFVKSVLLHQIVAEMPLSELRGPVFRRCQLRDRR